MVRVYNQTTKNHTHKCSREISFIIFQKSVGVETKRFQKQLLSIAPLLLAGYSCDILFFLDYVH